MTQRRQHIGFVGNVPPPIGGAEVFLGQFLRAFLARPRRACTLVRWRKQILYYFPERAVRTYAPWGTVRREGRLRTHYLFEGFQRRPYERASASDARATAHYEPQAARATEIFRQAGGVDLIHAHMLFPNLFFAATAARALSVPLVLTVHGLLEFRLLDHFRCQYPTFAARVERLLAEADVVVAVSDEIARECRRRGAKRVVKICGGIDMKVFRPAPTQPAGKDILFLGSVRKEKGASLLIRAFERVNGIAAGNLVFLGKPLLDDPMMARARRHRRIRFLGEQNAEGVRRALARAKMVVLPSVNEGMPMSILEAMACEKPVLVTATGELTRLIRDGRNGFLLQRRNVTDLARRMQDVAARDDLHRIGAAARRTARTFDIRNVVNRYDDLYQSLIC